MVLAFYHVEFDTEIVLWLKLPRFVGRNARGTTIVTETMDDAVEPGVFRKGEERSFIRLPVIPFKKNGIEFRNGVVVNQTQLDQQELATVESFIKNVKEFAGKDTACFVGNIYNIIPNLYLIRYKDISCFFHRVIKLLFWDNKAHLGPIMYKASVYSGKYNEDPGPRSIFSTFKIWRYMVGSLDSHRSHSEYYSSFLSLPLVLIKRGTIDRILRKFLSDLDFLIFSGESDRIVEGWKKFISLPFLRLINSTVTETESPSQLASMNLVNSPTTNFLLTNDILSMIEDAKDTFTLNSFSASNYYDMVRNAFGYGNSSAIFVPETCLPDNSRNYAVLDKNPFSDDMKFYYLSNRDVEGDVVTLMPRLSEIRGREYEDYGITEITVPNSNVYNVNQNRNDTVIIHLDSESYRVPIFQVMLLRELKTVLTYIENLTGLKSEELIPNIDDEVILTNHHFSEGFLCDAINYSPVDFFREKYASSAYGVFSEQNYEVAVRGDWYLGYPTAKADLAKLIEQTEKKSFYMGDMTDLSSRMYEMVMKNTDLSLVLHGKASIKRKPETCNDDSKKLKLSLLEYICYHVLDELSKCKNEHHHRDHSSEGSDNASLAVFNNEGFSEEESD